MKTKILKTLCGTVLALNLFCSPSTQAGEFEMVMWSIENPGLAMLVMTTFSPTLVPAITAESITGLAKEMGLHREEILATKEDALHFVESGEMSAELAEILTVVRSHFPETQKSTNQGLAVQLLKTIEANAF